MNIRPLHFLLPAACFLAAGAAHAQTPPAITPATITDTLTGFGTTTLLGQAADYRNYTFNITGFGNVGPDPTNAYTIYSFSNSTIEKSPNFYTIAAYNLPAGWTFSDTNDFLIATGARGIHATDPTFGLVIFQKAGTPAIDLSNAPFVLYHKGNGTDPFTDPIYTPVPEASTLASFGLLGGLLLAAQARRRRKA